MAPVTAPQRLIRPRRSSDLPALTEVLWAVHQQQGYPASWPDDPGRFIAPPGGDAWVAELRGQVVGQILLREVQDSPERSWQELTGHPTGRLGLVARLFIHPAASGQGLARELLATATAAARQQQRVPMLDVYAESQRAIELYERLGWQRTAEYTGHWLWRGEYPLVYVYVAPPESP